MTSAHPDRLVADYLRRLEVVAAVLPSERRSELHTEIRAHIDDALEAAGTSDEVTVRNVLERLGLPEEIVAAAGAHSTSGPMSDHRRVGPLEIAALIVLAVGGLVPLIGWAAGAILTVLSRTWTSREKAIGLLLGVSAPAAGLLLTLLASPGGGLGSLEVAILWSFLAGLPSAFYLAWRLRRGSVAPSNLAPTPAGAASV